MIIPEPKFERVRYEILDLGFWQTMRYFWRHVPQVKLVDDYVIALDDGSELVFPKGFVFDGASAPRWVWAVPGFSPFGPLLEGAIAHDFGYQHGYLLMRRVAGVVYPIRSTEFYNQYPEKFGDLIPVYLDRDQKFFDQLLRAISIEIFNAKVTANIAYAMLRRYGKNAWGNYRLYGPAAYNNNSLGLPGRPEET